MREGDPNSPNAVQVLTNGDLLIADQGNNMVVEINHAGYLLWQYDQGLNTASYASRLPNNDT